MRTVFYEPLSIKQRLVVVWVASVKTYLLSSAFLSWKLKRAGRIALSVVVGPVFIFNLEIDGRNQTVFKRSAITSQPIGNLETAQQTIASIRVRIIDESGRLHPVAYPGHFLQALNLQHGNPYDP